MYDYQFRLLDFNAYNKSGNDDECDNGDDDGGSDSSENIERFEIQMYGINEKGETCSIYVENYRPFFFVRVGNNWNERIKNSFFDEIKKKVGKKMSNQIISMELVDRKKLYGFDSGKMQKFVQITFENTTCFNRVKYLYYKKSHKGDSLLTTYYFSGYDTELYEAQIPPLLRFFHIRNISPSGWVGFNKSEIEIVGYDSEYDDDGNESYETNTTCNYEFIIDWNYIYPINDKETQVPYKICSFDIEASSSHGDFPIPIKNYKKLASNIVEYFRDYDVEMCDDSLEVELPEIIMNAFGFSVSMKELDCIDFVYPKNKSKITQEMIEKKLKKWLKNKISSLRKKTTVGQDDRDDRDDKDDSFGYGEGDGPGDGPGDEDGDGAEEEEEDNKKNTGYGWNKTKVKTSTTDINKLTVFGVLQSTTLDYDDKVNALTVSFNNFPPLEGDKVTFIGSTFLKYGSKEPYLNHCVVLDTCDEPTDIKNAVIETCDTEKDVLLKWRDIIVKEDPDIIIGYNIFGFDYDFMFQRAKENNCVKRFLKLSRNRDDICGKLDERGRIKSIETSKIVIASGEHDLTFIKMGGRLQIDLYNYFRRDFNLPSYKLDYVSSQFIGDNVKELIHTEDTNTTTIITKNMMGLEVGSFIHFEEISHSSELYKDGAKFKIKSINKEDKSFTISGIERVDMSKSVKWGLSKDDVTPQDIFRLSKESSAGRATIAKYCIQDCNLVHHLMNKIDVITGFIEMSTICSVPLDFLVMRGQGIKLTSFIAKKCMEKNTLMPVIQKNYNDTGYEGAIVLPPKCDLYLDNPVACVDYASLYPSSMISENLSHDSKVWTKEYNLNDILIKTTGEIDKDGNYIYDNLDGYQYVDITYDVYDYYRKTPSSAAEKRKIGYKICRWAQFPNGQKGIMPSILEELLAARKATRKLIPQQQDDFMKNILDKRQLSYKITANSLYGQCGARTSTFYEKDVAASTTATGRLLLTYAKRVVEEVYGDRICKTSKHGIVMSKAEYIYGDSVAKYTPTYIKVNNQIQIVEIEHLAEDYGNNNWNNFIENGKQEKEYCDINGVETWTESGWTKLHRVIRHKLAPHKKMVRILTHTGVVDVTDDHSLLLEDGNEISPKDVSIGTKLLQKTMKQENHSINNDNMNDNMNDNIELQKAKILGFFFGDGSCGSYKCPSGQKSSWALNNSNMKLIEKYMELCKECYPEYRWMTYDTLKSSKVYKISFSCDNYGEKKQFIDEYRTLLYRNNCKIIPDYILNGSIDLQKSFWEGLYDADGDKDPKIFGRIDQKNQISAAQICWLANNIGYNTSINTRTDKPNIYRINTTINKQRKCAQSIKKIENIEYNDYVYDLTTDNHHFAAGVGNIIVHNTDSVFFTFNLQTMEGEDIRGKKALEITIELAKEMGELASKFLKKPHDLEYEKTYMPFCLLSKKRYVGMLYQDTAEKCYQNSMGIVLKRRDNAPIVKDIYGGIIDILMKEQNIDNAIEFLKNALQNMIDEKIPMEKLIITKSLRSNYKNPKQIAHKVLADRIGKRDPGNKPSSGDRIPFAYVNVSDRKALQGDKIETPTYILENKLQIDYAHYITNQIMKPIQQLLALVLEEIPEFKKSITRRNRMKKQFAEWKREFGLVEDERYVKKEEDYRSKEIKSLLFDKYINKTLIEKNGIQSYFQKIM